MDSGPIHLSRRPAAKPTKPAFQNYAFRRLWEKRASSDARISSRGSTLPTPTDADSKLSEALPTPKVTIIVVFLVRADRLPEVIMNDHRPTSAGGASLAELEAGYARRKSPGGADRRLTRRVRTATCRSTTRRATSCGAPWKMPAFCSSNRIAVAVSCFSTSRHRPFRRGGRARICIHQRG